MKNAIIVALVCVNLLILVGLVIGTGSVDQAKAAGYVETEYIVIPAKVAKTEDLIYITNMDKKETIAFRLDAKTKKMVPFRTVRLLRDFGQAN
jgi:hypothetical protein